MMKFYANWRLHRWLKKDLKIIPMPGLRSVTPRQGRDRFVAEIVWTHNAKSWLEKIHASIAKDRPDAARRVILGGYEKVQLLR